MLEQDFSAILRTVFKDTTSSAHGSFHFEKSNIVSPTELEPLFFFFFFFFVVVAREVHSPNMPEK